MKKVHHFDNADQLKELVMAAQTGNQVAINTLCEAFKPLILKEAYRINIAQSLGEDAENTAWEIFLDFIYKYDKDSYLKLPGLLKKHLYFALLQKLQRQKSVVPTAMLNQTDANGQSLVEPSDGNRLMDEFYLKAQLSAALNKLTPKQKDVIVSTYLAGYSLTEYAEHNRITLAAACLLQKRALLALKANLA